MVNRFKKLFSLQNNLYIENAPIIVSAGSLLNDMESGNIIVQIKLKSVSKKNIKGVKISLSAYDISGKEISGVEEYQYLDLNIPNGQSFGSNKAIVMPKTTTRSFDIKSITVIFADSSIWEINSPDFVAIPNADTLDAQLKNEELVKQYRIATTNKANYVPKTFLNLWSCCCGEVNSEEYCTSCGTNKNYAFSKYDITDLTEAMNLRLDKERQSELERQEKLIALKKENGIKKKRILKRCILGTSICIGIVLLCFVVKLLFGNLINYNIAINSMEKGKYDKAIEIFTGLKDYKDSTDKLTETKYLLAEYYVSSEKYEEAYNGFLELKDYKDSAEKAEEYKTGEFVEEITIEVGCDLAREFIYHPARNEKELVLAQKKVVYNKGIPNNEHVEIVFKVHVQSPLTSSGWSTAKFKYVGEFKNNSITGNGKLYQLYDYYGFNADDAPLIYDGDFLNGMYNGTGNLYQDSLGKGENKLFIVGMWENGNVSGKYTRYYSDGTLNDTGTVKEGIVYSNKYGTNDYNLDYAKKPEGFDS